MSALLGYVLRGQIFRSKFSQLRRCRKSSTFSPLIDIKPEILNALQNNGPIVALESTIITHGMPYPTNIEMAREVEQIIRKENAIPATIAIINGRIKVGLNQDELLMLANSSKNSKNSKTDKTIIPSSLSSSMVSPSSSLASTTLSNVSQCDKSGIHSMDTSNERFIRNDGKHIDSVASDVGHRASVKTSRRDLAYVLSRNSIGGTTVAGTLIVANLIGIDVFATGGMGGVHRDGQNTMDISADLIELGRSAVAVVSSGVKSILDIPRTLEVLETQGVLVASYQNDDFPAFYTRSSGVTAPYKFDTPLEVAKAINASKILKLGSGMLIAVPVPLEYAMDETIINAAITEALQNCEKDGITGKNITPYVLAAITKVTEGKSLNTNVALVKNNAKVGAEIAVELSKLKNKNSKRKIIERNDNGDKVPVIIGGSIIDTSFTVLEGDIQLNGATYPSRLQVSAGGVGRNLAECIWKLYGSFHLVSVVGDDQNGKYLKTQIPIECQSGIEIDPLNSTANSAIAFDRFGEPKIMFCDMNIHSSITPDVIIKNEQKIANSPITIMDGNLQLETMLTLLDVCRKYNVPVFFEPTDMRICGKIFEKADRTLLKQIKFISPNIFELRTIAKSLQYSKSLYTDDILTDSKLDQLLNTVRDISIFVNETIDYIIVTLGPYGVLITTKTDSNSKPIFKNFEYFDQQSGVSKCRYYKCKTISNIVNVSGAGDNFASGYIVAMLKGHPEAVCVSVGFEAAATAMRSHSAVANEYFGLDHQCWRYEWIGQDVSE